MIYCIICECHYQEHEYEGHKHKKKHKHKKHHHHSKLKGISVKQLGGNMNNTLDSVTGLGTFQVGPVPSTESLPSGIIPSWTSSDTTVATVESPNSDSSGDTIIVSRSSDNGGSFTLTVALTLADGTILQESVSVSVPAKTVTGGGLTGLSITQIA